MASRTLKSVAYTAIRDAILNGELAPSTPVSEAQLQEMLGVSRTPIREALQRLAHENLVTLTPHKGAVVTGIDLRDCEDIFLIREMLEGLAAALAATHLPAEQIDTLQSDYERLAALSPETATAEMVAFGKGLHEIIRKDNGSRRLVGLLQIVRPDLDRLGFYQLAAPGRIQEAFREHGAIIASLRDRDPAAAESTMREHVRRSARTAVGLLAGRLYANPGAALVGEPLRRPTFAIAPSTEGM